LKFQSNPITGLGRLWGFQIVEAHRFQDNRHTKVAMLSAVRPGRFYPQEIYLVLISVRGWLEACFSMDKWTLTHWSLAVSICTTTFN
jgi:hypothetical protein